jgi:cytoskeletal protein CcmA (bactofilin family)
LKKNKNQFVNGNMTIIGAGTVIEGVLKASASMRIEGTVNGDITSEGVVVIANEGVVNGNITAVDVKISGTVEGNLTIVGKTELIANGKLTGDIKTGSLSIDETAVFQGNCKMNSVAEEEKTTVNEEAEEKSIVSKEMEE